MYEVFPFGPSLKWVNKQYNNNNNKFKTYN